MFNKTSRKGLTVAALAAGALFVATAADAAVNFRPGTSDTGGGVGCTAAVSNIFDAFFGGATDTANLCGAPNNAPVTQALDLMVWDTADVGLGDSTWFINIDTQTGAFTETFMMGLTTTSLNGVETGYGLNESSTYVTMELNLTGQMTSFDTDLGSTELIGTYDAGSTMTMRFHSDGSVDPFLADGSVIAVFNLVTPSVVQDGSLVGVTELRFRAEFDQSAGTPDGIFAVGSTDFNDTPSPILKVTTNTFNDGFVVSSVSDGLTVVRVGEASRASSVFQIPEPGALGLFGLGLLGLGIAARRQRKAAA